LQNGSCLTVLEIFKTACHGQACILKTQISDGWFYNSFDNCILPCAGCGSFSSGGACVTAVMASILLKLPDDRTYYPEGTVPKLGVAATSLEEACTSLPDGTLYDAENCRIGSSIGEAPELSSAGSCPEGMACGANKQSFGRSSGSVSIEEWQLRMNVPRTTMYEPFCNLPVGSIHRVWDIYVNKK